MAQTFVITKKKDIAQRNEKEFVENREKQEKYNAMNAYNKQILNSTKPKKKKNKNPQPQQPLPPMIYGVEDIEKLIDPISNQIPLRVRKHLKRMKPKIFSPNDDSYKMVGDWKTKWKKRPHLTDNDYKLLKRVFDTDYKKVQRHRMINEMIEKANVYNAPFPHKKFCLKIAKVDGVIIDRIEIAENNDTTVYFKYKGNDIIGICYGVPFEDCKKHLPSKLIINGVETDISRKNVDVCIKQIKPKVKKVVIVKKKPTI